LLDSLSIIFQVSASLSPNYNRNDVAPPNPRTTRAANCSPSKRLRHLVSTQRRRNNSPSPSYQLFLYVTNWYCTQLNVTMIMPAVPAAPGIHYIWPGLQPNSDAFVFQDVGGDEEGSGSWTFAEWAVDSKYAFLPSLPKISTDSF